MIDYRAQQAEYADDDDPPVRRTDAEIQALKDAWERDGDYDIDIEDTEGFEAHYQELRGWREAHEAAYRAAHRAAHRARAAEAEANAADRAAEAEANAANAAADRAYNAYRDADRALARALARAVADADAMSGTRAERIMNTIITQAAAHDLRDALEAALELFGQQYCYSDGTVVGTHSGSGGRMLSVGGEWVLQARAAIAAAAGDDRNASRAREER